MGGYFSLAGLQVPWRFWIKAVLSNSMKRITEA
jgi:hypothetical protein